MPRQADPATPGELAERIAKLPAWARKHIEAREELIRVLGRQLSEAQAAQQQGTQPSARDVSEDTADLTDYQFAGFYRVRYISHETTAGAKVLIVEGLTGPLLIRPVTASEIIIARGLQPMARTQIGTVLITRPRIYKIDPDVLPEWNPATAVVEPGEYPVYRDGMTTYWRMTGVLNHRSARLGDGMFIMHDTDVRSDDDVVFYSRRYGPDEWADLLAEFRAAPDPRLVFRVTEPEPAP